MTLSRPRLPARRVGVARALHDAVRPARLLLVAKTALAVALVAWLIAPHMPGVTQEYPYYAPLGALVSMYPTLMGSARSSLQTLLGLATGIGLATVVVLTVGPNWWTIPLVVAVGVLLSGTGWFGVGREYVPMAALFVLIIGGQNADDYSSGRRTRSRSPTPRPSSGQRWRRPRRAGGATPARGHRTRVQASYAELAALDRIAHLIRDIADGIADTIWDRPAGITLDAALPEPLSAACHAVADVIARGDASSSEDHRAREDAARAIRILLEVIDERTVDVRRTMGPGVLTTMHLRRILILSGTPCTEPA